MSRHIPDAIAGFFGYVSKRELSRRLDETATASARAGFREGREFFDRSVQDEVSRRAGEIEAERNGYKAQWEQAERRLRVANRRLQRADLMPVTSFV